jgi:hypothetical protein
MWKLSLFKVRGPKRHQKRFLTFQFSSHRADVVVAKVVVVVVVDNVVVVANVFVVIFTVVTVGAVFHN